QTITPSVVLGLATLYSLQPGAPPFYCRNHVSPANRETESTVYWTAGLASILYPGTDWVDPEFGPSGAQIPVFVGFASAAVLGWDA
ncbi:hypothetical protein L209DRAFT_690971, partial [Thermothelomyces heterothallicus CBS 203.75]